MRVVSLVPSWTETLLECGVEVVGRTRFCIHPAPRVRSIPVIGGTKDWDLKAIAELKPDLVVLDREENPKSMSEESQWPWLATHVASCEDLPRELALLQAKIPTADFRFVIERWERVLREPKLSRWNGGDFPGLIEWGQKPKSEIEKIVYVIWKNPWMAVSKKTFIGSVLERCGLGTVEFSKKYPEFLMSDFTATNTLFLFSSEPFPFLKQKRSLEELGVPYAIVNGESFSWFGIRSLKFLEEALFRP
jgi:hypothetical protein